LLKNFAIALKKQTKDYFNDNLNCS